ncbi:response regulator [Paenibacillus sp. P22]|uniref:response regulator n=1 Tax=Paenibacillus sp. P22 TaxID=483908 RepID=UPI000431A739|nr:response regulator [Paenibacillus sp. P22]CDN41872.1 Two component transcriptional regulator, AraC family [Paenibacillus sp. P22]
MLSLLIVDDEKNIRLGLQAMIDRQFAGKYSYLFAENGREAMELLARESIDIMITDIRMPVMDGIGLLERMQELPAIPAVIILSGHDDFPYARAAIRYQAKEYLLKPIVREELFAVLERLEEEAERRKGREEAAASSPAGNGDEAGGQLAYVLSQDRIDVEEIRGRLTGAGLGWLDEGYSVGLLKIPDSAGADALSLIVRAVKMLGGEEERWTACRDREGLLVIAAAAEGLLRRLSEQLSGNALLAARMALSSRASGIAQLRRSYSQARQVLKYFLLYPESELLSYAGLGDRSSGCPVPVDAVRRLSNILGTGKLQEMKRLLQQILDIRTVSRCEIGYLEAISRVLNEEVFDSVFRHYGEESIEILRLYRRAGHIENFDRFDDYYRLVEQLLERLDEYVAGVRGAHGERKDMQKAVEYLHEHFASDVNMAVVSNHISLNYTYFSQAFKEYTGESFSVYLRRLRLAKAKELLGTSDRKVYEISTMSGFDNVKHFTRVFKEVEGITPLEYRSRQLAHGAGRS